MKTAIKCGISLSEFWDITPYQLSIIAEAKKEQWIEEHNNRVWIMWHGEAIQRAKTFPKLKELMYSEKPAGVVDEDYIKGRMRAYQKQRESKKNA